jgi:broad specificity phosphatase PhoE
MNIQGQGQSMNRRIFIFLLGICAVFSAQAVGPAGRDAAWLLLKAGGHVVLIRHAVTDPGVGDPPGFALGDCATQRNLSAAGRRAARQIGTAFHHHGIEPGPVLTSRWCRCIETARLAFGRAEPAPMLDSMFDDDNAARERKLRAVHAWVSGNRQPGNLILVTHDVNIRALTGDSVAPGEMLITQAGSSGLKVIGRLKP